METSASLEARSAPLRYPTINLGAHFDRRSMRAIYSGFINHSSRK